MFNCQYDTKSFTLSAISEASSKIRHGILTASCGQHEICMPPGACILSCEGAVANHRGLLDGLFPDTSGCSNNLGTALDIVHRGDADGGVLSGEVGARPL